MANLSRTVIVIPARYGSKRFPGKPLAMIAGKTMLQRVCETATKVSREINNVHIVVATDDERIYKHAEDLIKKGLNIKVVMTPEDCPTGSDRALAVCNKLDFTPDIIVNLQGDNPLTPPSFIIKIINALTNNKDSDVATPVINLSWEALDDLRKRKVTIPFTGTTAILDKDSNAIWFSKNIIPAIRPVVEADLRNSTSKSPIYQHVGLYGYKMHALKTFVALPQTNYEKLESLEQLRIIENNMKIKAVVVDYDGPSLSGVDTIEDAQRVEQIILKNGEPINA